MKLKLNKEQKVMLIEMGYAFKDFPQIEYAMRKDVTYYEYDNNRISREEVIELIGMKEYLSGIGRSAFHYTSVRSGVYFDSSKLFKSWQCLK